MLRRKCWHPGVQRWHPRVGPGGGIFRFHCHVLNVRAFSLLCQPLGPPQGSLISLGPQKVSSSSGHCLAGQWRDWAKTSSVLPVVLLREEKGSTLLERGTSTVADCPGAPPLAPCWAQLANSVMAPGPGTLHGDAKWGQHLCAALCLKGGQHPGSHEPVPFCTACCLDFMPGLVCVWASEGSCRLAVQTGGGVIGRTFHPVRLGVSHCL